MTPPRILFYVQHLLGIGHLARASRIATALVEDGFDVTLVMGGRPVAGFPDPAAKTVALPPVTSGDQGFSGLADANVNPIDDAFKKKRRLLLLQTFRDCRPDIVILEAFPFGRRQMRFELLPLIETIRNSSPRPLLVASVRDILQERLKPGRNEESVDLIERYFDLVMVHGDPNFATFGQSFPLASMIEDKLAYTGLVAAPPPPPAALHFDVVVSAGGGAAGGELVRATVEAAKISTDGQSWCLISGPNLPAAEFDAISKGLPPRLSLFRFRDDFASLLTGARLSVSQAGYNTVCDVLRAGCRSLLVPFTAGGETEQATRAAGLEGLGLARVLTEPELTPVSLTAAIDAALAGPKPRSSKLNLEGARGTVNILRGLLKARSEGI